MYIFSNQELLEKALEHYIFEWKGWQFFSNFVIENEEDYIEQTGRSLFSKMIDCEIKYGGKNKSKLIMYLWYDISKDLRLYSKLIVDKTEEEVVYLFSRFAVKFISICRDELLRE